MPYSFVWLYLLKCIFTCSIFVDSNKKNIFECFRCFWKVLCFYKNWKISKTMLACFGDSSKSQVIQVACYSHELACWFWRLVREWKVHSWGVHRDFHGLTCDSLAGRPSSREKHLEIFFTILTLSVLAACPGDLLVTQPSRKKRVFGKKWVSF